MPHDRQKIDQKKVPLDSVTPKCPERINTENWIENPGDAMVRRFMPKTYNKIKIVCIDFVFVLQVLVEAVLSIGHPANRKYCAVVVTVTDRREGGKTLFPWVHMYSLRHRLLYHHQQQLQHNFVQHNYVSVFWYPGWNHTTTLEDGIRITYYWYTYPSTGMYGKRETMWKSASSKPCYNSLENLLESVHRVRVSLSFNWEVIKYYGFYFFMLSINFQFQFCILK